MKLKSVSLTEGHPAKSLIKFAIPLLLSNLFQQLYTSVDTAVVGTFAGSAALAAVGSTGTLINLLTGFFIGISTGAGVIYAMRFGAKDYVGMKKTADSAFLLSIAASIFITFVGCVFAKPFLKMMSTPDDVIDLCALYLRIHLAGTIVNLLYNVGAGLIRACGDSARPLIYLFASGILNLILDDIFVARMDMGVAGAALATIIAQALSAVLVIRYMMVLMPPEYRFRPMKMRFDRIYMAEVIKVSVPCGLQSSMFNIANLLVQAKINSFGSIAMAGVSAYSKIDGFVYMSLNALTLTISTYVGQNIGAGKYNRVKKGINSCLVISIAVGLFLGLSVLLGFDYVIGLFTKDADTIAYAKSMMYYMAPFACICTFTDIYGGAIRGAGSPLPVTIISALCICVFRVVWMSTVLVFIKDIRAVYICYPISWALSSIVMTVYYHKTKIMKRIFELAAANA